MPWPCRERISNREKRIMNVDYRLGCPKLQIFSKMIFDIDLKNIVFEESSITKKWKALRGNYYLELFCIIKEIKW